MQNVNIKYIGIIKWFPDTQKNTDYGFINHKELGDVYYNVRNIAKGQPKEKFKENDIVVFKSRKSIRKKDSFEAIDIILIENEQDIDFLFTHFLLLLSKKGRYSKHNRLQKSLFQSIQKLYPNISNSKKTSLINQFKKFISQFEFNQVRQTNEISPMDQALQTHKSVRTAKTIIDLIRLLFKDEQEQIISHLIRGLDNNINYKLWLEKFHNQPDIKFISTIIISENNNKSEIFSRLNNRKLEILKRSDNNIKKGIASELLSHLSHLGFRKKKEGDYIIKTFQTIKELDVEISQSEKIKLINIFKKFISKFELNYEKAITVINLTQSLFKEEQKQIISHLTAYLDENTNYKLWLEKFHNQPDIEFIFTKVFSQDSNKSRIIKRSDNNTKNKLFLKFLSILDSIKSKDNDVIEIFQTIEKLNIEISSSNKKKLINLIKKFIPQLELNYQTSRKFINLIRFLFKDEQEQIISYLVIHLDKDINYKLWIERIHNHPNIDFISTKIFPDNSQVLTIFARCDNETKNELFFNLIFNLGLIENRQSVNKAIKIFELCQKYHREGYFKVSEKIIKQSPSYTRLFFWLKGFTDYFNYDEFVTYTITLTVDEQKLFLKKVFKLIHEQKITLKLSDFDKFTFVAPSLYQEFENNKDKLHDLDFTISIILKVIKDLSQRVVTKQKTIFEIIANQVKKPRDLLQIEGFFDECNGRSIVKETPIKGDKGEEIDKRVEFVKLQEKPRFAIYCDGRKSPSVCENTGLDFWWCENKKCYKPERELHISKDWNNYSLLDMLNILKVDFVEKDYEILLNVINKANRFLGHLTCRECNEILRPKNQTNFSFWGVSNFHCKNQNCTKHNEKIYISHCMNGKCSDIIDSRDCVTCKPNEFDDCGWYVCNFCHACCNSPQLERRKWVYENILKKNYPCHLKGHKDLGELSCNKCGTTMNRNKFSEEAFNSTLNWFIENRGTNPHIRRSGQRKDGKWWFMFAKNTLSFETYRIKLTSLLKLGFNIPDYQKEEKILQLIAEPLTKRSVDIFSCSNCNHTIDLNNDYKKYQAMKDFHSNLFKN